MRSGRRSSIAGRVLAVQLGAVLLIGGALLVLLWADARRAADDDAATLSLAVCETIAADPAVVEGLGADDPTGALQPYALAVVDAERVDFVTIMSPDGERYTHPDPEQIGGRFLGTIDQAQRGETLTETYTGTLGPSVRAVVPILDGDEVVGIISAGVTVQRVESAILPRIPFVVATSVLVVAVGTLASWIVHRSLGRATGRMSEPELRNMVRFYESVLHSVREGVVLTDGERRVVLYNDEAADLLGLPPATAEPRPVPPRELGISGDVAELLESGRRVVEEAHVAGDRVLLVNQESALPPGRSVDTADRSAVMTLRDQSRLQSLVGELESVRTMTDALRAQAHEHANTLHTVVSLIELGRTHEAAELVESATRTSQGLADAVLGRVADPVLGALLLGKAAQASERGIAFELDADPAVALPLAADGIVSVVGNLVDNALEAALQAPGPRRVAVRIAADGDRVVLAVEDSGGGVDGDDAERAFEFGVTTKRGGSHGIGLAVVREIVAAHGGEVAFLAGAPTTVEVRLAAGGAS